MPGDALHLAAALELRERLEEPVEFLTFDERLREAAEAEGFPTGFSSPARSRQTRRPKGAAQAEP